MNTHFHCHMMNTHFHSCQVFCHPPTHPPTHSAMRNNPFPLLPFSLPHDEYPFPHSVLLPVLVPTPLGTFFSTCPSHIQNPAQLGILQGLGTCCFFGLLDRGQRFELGNHPKSPTHKSRRANGLNGNHPKPPAHIVYYPRKRSKLGRLAAMTGRVIAPPTCPRRHPESGANRIPSATWALSPRLKGWAPSLVSSASQV